MSKHWGICLVNQRRSGFLECAQTKTVAALSCKAEYIAMFEAAKEAIWLRSLLNVIDIHQTAPTPMMCDNMATIDLSKDPLLHTHVKHINIKYHFL